MVKGRQVHQPQGLVAHAAEQVSGIIEERYFVAQLTRLQHSHAPQHGYAAGPQYGRDAAVRRTGLAAERVRRAEDHRVLRG